MTTEAPRYLIDREGAGKEIVEAIVTRLDGDENLDVLVDTAEMRIEKLVLASRAIVGEFIELEMVRYEGVVTYEINHRVNSSFGWRTSFYVILDEEGRMSAKEAVGEPMGLFGDRDNLEDVLEAISGPDEWKSIRL